MSGDKLRFQGCHDDVERWRLTQICFITVLYNEFQEDSVYRNEQNFAVLLTSQRSLWYTCCNQVRGELIFKAKEKYFSAVHRNRGVIIHYISVANNQPISP